MNWIKNHPWLPLGVLVAICAVLDFVVFDACKTDVFLNSQSWLQSLAFAFGISQGCLLGIWAALGGKRPYQNALIVFLGLIVCICVTKDSGGVLWEIWFVLSAEQSINMFIVLIVARTTGLGLSCLRHEDSNDVRRPFQFTVGEILAWTTTTAIILGAARYVPRNDFSDYVYGATMTFVWPFVALPCIWLVLGKSLLIIRLLLAASSASLGAIADCHSRYTPLVSFPISEYILPSVFFSCIICTGLIIVRLSGYRLTWHWRFKRPARQRPAPAPS
jgi:hypothetical protein